ncbi:CDP-diacylglycerol--serine O-phosphatidyltransferase [bacterium]|nr:CDP-diacylglycerol--serine O-phosphatidyltransferase [bacterium]MCI0601845.1 CDP-diacylglycerol--serine O-phosphatidyltransferase [bacterium]
MRQRKWTKAKIREKSRRGMYIIPSLFTVSNIFCGFYSISSAIQGNFERAGLLIGIAMILDTLDGRIARMTHTSSAFGVQLDSLADVITFGVAPAVVCYQWAFYHFENRLIDRAGWIACFLFIICAASRLARFNVQTTGHPDKRYFTGMPTPASAGFVAATIYYFPERVAGEFWAIVAVAIMLILAFLMVSRIRYRTFKDLDLKQPRSYRTIVLIALIIGFMAFDLKRALITLAVIYAVSGIVGMFSRKPKPEAPQPDPSAPVPVNPS